MVKRLPIMRETQFEKILWRRKWQATPVLLPGKSHGQRDLVGYSPTICYLSYMGDACVSETVVCILILFLIGR